MTQPMMGSDASPGEQPILHTSTGEWQSFEQRMRQRRIDRLLVRARQARDDGRDDEARAALEEIRHLNGEAIELPPLQSAPLEPAPFEPPPFEPPPFEPALAPPPDIPQIVEVSVHGSGLDAFNSEAAIDGFDDFVSVPVFDEDDTLDEPSDSAEGVEVEDDERGISDLPLYPQLLIASEKPHASWGPRVVGLVAAFSVVLWFAGPRFSGTPETAVAEDQPELPVAGAGTSGTVASEITPPQPAAEPVPESSTPELTTNDQPLPDSPTNVAAAANSGAPVPLTGVERSGPLATSPEPNGPLPDAPVHRSSVLPEAAPLVPVASSTPAPVPMSSAPTFEAVAPPVAPPAPPPVDTAPRSSPATPTTPMTSREAPSPETPVADAAAGVRATLLRYESAYSRLDAEAAGAVWPGLDRKALARAFEGLASQQITLGSCEVRIVGETAIADCAGSARWTPKVGGKSHREARRWQFRLRSADDGWQILSASVR